MNIRDRLGRSFVYTIENIDIVRGIKVENLIFLDEMRVLLGILREYGRCLSGKRLYAQKPFYRGERIIVIG